MNSTGDINFMQVQEHCGSCHCDYFGSHTCTPSIVNDCPKCKIKNDLIPIMSDFIGKECYKWCPYCGHKL